MARWLLVRDVGIWVAGLLALAHEVLVTHGERPYLLILIAGLLGLPTFLRLDGRGGTSAPPASPPGSPPGQPEPPPLPGPQQREPMT